MGGVIEYSGIVTKVRAMNRNLLKAEDYEALLECQDFASAISLLKTLPGYAEAFEGTVDNDMHRDMCERRLMNSLYLDFSRLYHFAGLKIRDYLITYFKHYEIMLIKQSLRNVINLQSPDIQLEGFDEFFHKHSVLTMDGLNHCDTIPEFMNALAGSEYEKLFMPIFQSGSTRLADYEEALDFYYFSQTWKVINKTLGKGERAQVLASFGCDIDLLNLTWIMRCKQFTSLTSADTKRLLIPIYYKLSESVIDALINADSQESAWSVLSETVYRSKITLKDMDNLSAAATKLVNDMYRQQKNRSPYSIATIACYLHAKETEIGSLIRVLEAIRYGLPRQEAAKYIITTK